jgi:hypothetical protein
VTPSFVERLPRGQGGDVNPLRLLGPRQVDQALFRQIKRAFGLMRVVGGEVQPTLFCHVLHIVEHRVPGPKRMSLGQIKEARPNDDEKCIKRGECQKCFFHLPMS